jgi:hypothetical protein
MFLGQYQMVDHNQYDARSTIFVLMCYLYWVQFQKALKDEGYSM